MSRLIRRAVAITITERWTSVWTTKDENADQSTAHLPAQRKEQPMNEPIYRFFRGRFTNAWHQLTQPEKDQIFAKMGQAFQAIGKSLASRSIPAWKLSKNGVSRWRASAVFNI